MFKITVYYQTGNSFGLEEAQEELGVVLNNLEEALDCLNKAKEHFEFAKRLEETNRYGAPPKSRDKLIRINKDKPWYSKDYPEGCFIYNGKSVSAFYLGYFETLYKLKIEHIDSESDSMVFIPEDYY